MTNSKNVLRAFSSLPRIKILICLKEKEKNVGELIKNCGLSQSAVSQHLKKLKNWGLVSCYKQGKEVYYKLTKKQAALIAEKLLVFYKHL
jgi:DNA-binding transcriptional ArsR family regulator